MIIMLALHWFALTNGKKNEELKLHTVPTAASLRMWHINDTIRIYGTEKKHL